MGPRKDKMGSEMEEKVRKNGPFLSSPGADQRWEVRDENWQERRLENRGKDRPERGERHRRSCKVMGDGAGERHAKDRNKGWEDELPGRTGKCL